MRAVAALALVANIALAAGGCSSAQLPGLDDGLPTPRLDALHPALVLPSTRIDLVGAGFAEPERATTRLVLRGTFTPTGGSAQPISATLPATEVDDTHAFAVAAGGAWPLPPGAGRFDGTAVAQSLSALDGSVRESPVVDVGFDVADTLVPHLSSLTAGTGGSVHVNDPIVLGGDGFLLGGGEGETRVVVNGVELVAHPLPEAPWDRTRAAFAFAPSVAGIKPGSFSGTVAVRNVFPAGADQPAGTLPLAVTIVAPEITAVAPTAASLGQYVDVSGAGFVGDGADEVTLLHLVGSFMADGGGRSAPVDLTLVPHFAAGNQLRYVLDEADALGRLIDLRRISGKFVGTVTPLVRKGADEVAGAPAAATLAIAPVKQVIYVRFLPSYVESLRLYGLANADALVRARIFAVAARDYAGVNVEFRDRPPTDFALYSQVDVEGPDPNALGLLGYDNTPGKDVGNQRLFDRIGGVNATTQSDGFPGYGGIFAESFFGFSAHPVSRVARLDVDPTHFDAIFDAVRPDTGTPVSAAELRAGVPALADGGACVGARDRATRIGCAVFVLGNLIGTTLTHEAGHSLGLADPTGEAFHDAGDALDRLMDAGGDRPFEERAELLGRGPAV
ncbi:MAG TPA: hypothetical protein VF997_00700, partial [Polyangia bacterium]